MTRETKIGLLVGLAFIIIVGILLGDSVRHATDVQPAPLPQAGNNVRTAVATPGVATAAPPISLQAGPQQQQPNVSPNQPVPMHDEVARPGNGGVVVIGPGAGNGAVAQPPTNPPQAGGNTLASQRGGVTDRGNEISIEPPRGNDDGAGGAQQPPVAQPPRTAGPIVAHGGSNSSDPRLRAANLHGEELVPLGSHPDGNERNARPTSGTASLRVGKSYEAQPGDTLSKIASRFYGSNSKALRDAILAANPSLKGNPDKILVGQTYTIPAVDTAPVQGSPQQSASPPQREPQQAAAPRGGSNSAGEYWYTVKENDNLWRIARDQLGDPTAVAVLKELNKDVLKGGDTVRTNMKLRLPAKPLASAN